LPEVVYNSEVDSPRCNFGRLLEDYRRRTWVQERRRWMTERDLEVWLRQVNYPIADGLISKYELGQRTPPPAIFYYLGVCLALPQEKELALINAHLKDEELKFWRAYRDVLKRHDQDPPIADT